MSCQPYTCQSSDFQQLENTILSLCNELSELRLYYYLLIASQDDTIGDITNEKVEFFLSLFCSRFSFKDIQDINDKAHSIHEMFASLKGDLEKV